MMGARHFGGKRQRRKQACVMVAELFVLPRYLSDVAGNDPAAHGSDPQQVIRIVRDHLHYDPAGRRLPGTQHLTTLFGKFRDDLPALAARARLTLEETHARRSYRNYMDLLRSFRDALPEIARGAD
jgi:hypothetical protein